MRGTSNMHLLTKDTDGKPKATSVTIKLMSKWTALWTLIWLLFSFFLAMKASGQQMRSRDMGIKVGLMTPGQWNAITDVPGVRVGHTTLIQGDSVRTGATAIVPHEGNVFQEKLPAAVYVGNGYGKLMGSTQVAELGNLETPILLTNTLNVPRVADALLDYMLALPGNEEVRSINAVVGETNDGFLNDIRGRHVRQEHVQAALTNAQTGPVKEGNVGAGTGTVCFGFKGGIGTASRHLPQSLGGYTVGVLVQTNFGGVLQIDGVPVGEALDKYYFKDQLQESADGSCLIVVATDAPLLDRNLERLAKRALLGLGKTGGIASNGSGDYVIAFSTSPENRIHYQSQGPGQARYEVRNTDMSPLFMAVIEATEEAIYNSLFMAETMVGRDGNRVEKLPIAEVKKILKEYGYPSFQK